MESGKRSFQSRVEIRGNTNHYSFTERWKKKRARRVKTFLLRNQFVQKLKQFKEREARNSEEERSSEEVQAKKSIR